MNPIDRTTAIPALPKQGGQANVPGLRRLWLIEARHLLGVIDPRTLPGFLTSNWLLSPTGLNLGEDATLIEFRFPPDRANHEQKAANSVQGVVYNQRIVLDVPRDHPTTALAVQRMSGRKFVAICLDANGLYKVIGTAKQPLRFIADFSGKPNNYTFAWGTSTKQPAYFFNDTGLFVDSDSDFSTEFSNGFSYDFFS